MHAREEDGVTAFGKYRVLGGLGEGGMGTVYLVADPDGNRYALKALKPDVAKDVQYVHRFLRETRMALRVNHRHIVRTFDSGHAPDGTLYMVSEYCSGGSADGQLETTGPIGGDLALRWMAGMASALDYAWRTHSMVHRDIKPENLLFDAEGRIKIADLGLAKRTTADATQLTADGTTMGTASYMSPEQAQARPDIDCRTDLYSLGATFYHLLAGQVMFTGETVVHVLRQHVGALPVPLSDYRPDLPEQLVWIIHWLVQKDPADRPGGPDVLLGELKRIGSALGIALESFDQGVVVTMGEPAGKGHETMPDDGLETIPEDSSEATAYRLGRRDSAPLALHRVQKGTPPGPWPEPHAWIEIAEAGGRRWDVALYTGFPVRFGRSRSGEVEMPLRVYPIEENRELCMKISTVHGEFGATDAGWSVTDLGSRNGVSVGGRRIEASVPCTLPAEAKVHVSEAMRLDCLTIRKSLPGSATIDGRTFAPAASPGLVVLRPDNRSELAYVLIRDRLPVGGADPSRALILPGMTSSECGSLWWFDNGFYWQPAEASRTLRPDQVVALVPGTRWRGGTLRFRIRSFSYDLFK